jgi:Family of unknown function (DUF5345)
VKKQKVIRLGLEQQNKLDLNVIQDLQEGFNKIDQFPVYSPDLQWFEQMVMAEKMDLRKKLIKELSLFILLALLILSVITVSLYQMPVIFIVLQIITTIFIALYTGLRVIKKVNNP